MTVNLDRYTKIIADDFDDGLSSIWSTGPRRGAYTTNSPSALFLDGSEVDAHGQRLGIEPISVEGGVLTLGSGVIPDAKLDDARALLASTGEDRNAGKLRYYTSMIATDQTWSQTYGYIEVVAKVPAGKGHWSAFWLASANAEWPPEIDIAEVYGKGLHGRTPKDNVLSSATYFDQYDETGAKVHDIGLTNPYDLDAHGNPARPSGRPADGRSIPHFLHLTDASKLGLDLYHDFVTYAVEWTPDYVSYLIGADRDSLVEIYRTPTPDDVKQNMYFIANDQVGSTWGWNPVKGHDAETFAADNMLQLDSISIYARTPDAVVSGAGFGALVMGGAGPAMLVGTAGDDVVVTGSAYEEIALRGGNDAVFVAGGDDNKVVSGFGAGDVVVLEGWTLDGTADVLSRLVQVGGDVWLPNGADPDDPQTIIFRDAVLADFGAESFVVRWSETPDIWSDRRLDAGRLTNAARTGVVVADPAGSKLSDVGGGSLSPVKLVGSAGGDLYYVYGRHTTIVEAAGGGVDTVHAYRSATLDANVETLIGDSAADGLVLTGNDLGNVIVAGKGAQVLDGAGGDDLLDLSLARGGTVVYRGAGGHDTVIGFDRNDRLVLEHIDFPSRAALDGHLRQLGADVILDLGAGRSVTFRGTDFATLAQAAIVFDTGADTLAGTGFDPHWRPAAGTPDSWLQGGAGPLSGYTVIHADATGRAMGTAGRDALFAGDAGSRLMGKDEADLLTSGAGDDMLNGGSGADRLEAGDGADRLWGQQGRDVFVFAPGTTGVDQIKDFSATDGDRIDLSRFGASADAAGVELVERGDRVEILDADAGSTIAWVAHAELAEVRAALVWDA